MFLYNSNDRTPIDAVYTTIKFKSVFPDFTAWKENLLYFGVAIADIKESDYNMLSTMIGNSHLRFKTGVKNKGFVATVFRKELFKMKKMKTLTSLTQDQILKHITKNTQTLFTIDREINGDATAEFTDNKTVAELENTLPVIEKLKELQQFNNINDPELMFLFDIAGSILLPLQPEQINKGVL